MNLAIRGIEANLGSQAADSFLRNLHPDLKADYILANPFFNDSDWSGNLLQDDVRWRYGTPPAGNANYAWIQHFIHHLAPPNGRGGGVAGFVMANGSLSSGSGGEGEIRQRIIEADLVDAIVALPPQLFLTTGIPACLWFLTRDKTGRNLRASDRARTGETLFIDARKLGTMQTRALRVLTGGDDGETLLADGLGDPNHDSDIGRIVYTFRQWRGEPAPAWWEKAEHGEWVYRDIPGFCKAETIEGIKKHGFVLTPGRYVGAEMRRRTTASRSRKSTRGCWRSWKNPLRKGSMVGWQSVRGKLGTAGYGCKSNERDRAPWQTSGNSIYGETHGICAEVPSGRIDLKMYRSDGELTYGTSEANSFVAIGGLCTRGTSPANQPMEHLGEYRMRGRKDFPEWYVRSTAITL